MNKAEIEILQNTSGLTVRCEIIKKERRFIFSIQQDQEIASFFTYKKAKAFAKGVSIGRELHQDNNKIECNIHE